MLNVLFSTTRQWNVGDEFILFGAVNIIRSYFTELINPIIYNRHPDLRTDMQSISDLHNVKIYNADEITMRIDANFRVGFRDNSFKLSLDGQFIDLVVFAGTPEWSNVRCLDLYQIIEKYNLPVIALGIGNRIQEEHEIILRNLNRFQLFTVRSPELVEMLKNRLEVEPLYLPCPSLCGAEGTKIRTIDTVKNIGLIYSCDGMRSEINNCVSTATYNYILQFFHKLKNQFPEYHFSLICHYVDELPFAHSDFLNMEIFYSFDAKDYYDIYNQFDLVIGARVHGIGCAASMAIPGICLIHDFRGETVTGFLAEEVNINLPLESAIEVVEYTISTIAAKNRRLKEHIAKTKKHYMDLLCSLTLPTKNLDNYSPALIVPVSNIFNKIPDLFETLCDTCHIAESKTMALNEQLQKYSIHIEKQADEIKQLENQVGEYETEIENQKNKLQEKEAFAEKQTDEIKQLENQICEYMAIVENKNIELNTRSALIGNQCSELEYKSKIIDTQFNQINELSMRLEEKSLKLDALYNSRSWKITAPLRKFFSFFKRIFKGD